MCLWTVITTGLKNIKKLKNILMFFLLSLKIVGVNLNVVFFVIYMLCL